MYAHHLAAIEKLKEIYSADPENRAIILNGSVPKGMERVDSDIDAVIVVSDRHFAELKQVNKTSDCVFGHCDYEGGYFDLKFVDMNYMREAAERGSEPTRASFVGSKILYSLEPSLPELLDRITRYPVEDKVRIRIFHSGLCLNYGYFWRISANGINPYFRARATVDIVYFGLRMLYAYNEVFFPCQKGMMQYLQLLPQKPENIEALALELLAQPDDSRMEAFTKAILNFTEWPVGEEYAVICSTYINNFEQWWRENHPYPNPYEI